MFSGYSDRGIILGTADYKDADKFISLLTQNHGLVHVFARGVRRIGSKKGPHLDLFQLVRFQTQRGSGLVYLQQVDTENFFPQIKSNFGKVQLAMVLAEILNNTLAQDVPDEEVFGSLLNYLDALNQNTDTKTDNRLTQKFGLYLLRHLGFPPPVTTKTDNLSNYFETIINKKIIANEIR